LPSTSQRLLIELYEWLACADSPSDGDLIFVLAGQQRRKSYGLALASRGRAPRLLLSVGRCEIRRFNDLCLPVRLNLPQMAASVPPTQRHLFVYLANGTSEIEFICRGQFGTLTEIRALKTWLAARNEIRSVLIVSSAAHLRRVRLCCRSLLPACVGFRLVAVEEEEPWLRPDSWWQTSRTKSIVLSEFPKLLLYWFVLHLESLTRMWAPLLFNHYEGVT
jgi:uncharacterized SAM-binding protein YcdF (DUF218 family)